MDILVDIDTLADNSHRQHILENDPQDWTTFFEAMKDDEPIQPIVKLVRDLYYFDNSDYEIILITGKPENFRDLTVKWLRKYKIPDDILYMRKHYDCRPDHVVKLELYQEIKKHFRPKLVIDNRQSVVDMWREQGLICLQMKDCTL
jgi:hypothetical protein